MRKSCMEMAKVLWKYFPAAKMPDFAKSNLHQPLHFLIHSKKLSNVGPEIQEFDGLSLCIWFLYVLGALVCFTQWLGRNLNLSAQMVGMIWEKRRVGPGTGETGWHFDRLQTSKQVETERRMSGIQFKKWRVLCFHENFVLRWSELDHCHYWSMYIAGHGSGNSWGVCWDDNCFFVPL